MGQVENKIHRFTVNQLRTLYLLAQSPKGVISSTSTGKELGVEGKALGAIFSSLSRQTINGQSLIIPWGKSIEGRGLNWKLNTHLIRRRKLLHLVHPLLEDVQ